MPFPDDYLRRTLTWLRHLDQEGLITANALRRHLGDSALEAPFPEAVNALENAVRDGAGAATKTAASKILARCLSCASKTIETARRRHGRSWIVDDLEGVAVGRWNPPRYEVLEDHELVLPTAAFGAPRIFLNAVELEGRYPGAFSRFLSVLEPTGIKLEPVGSTYIVKTDKPKSLAREGKTPNTR